MWNDYLKFAIQGIKNRKLRSWLTMVGVFIGIIAVVTLISLGQGLQLLIDEQFEKVGGDRIAITPGGGGLMSGAPGGSFVAAKLTEKDLEVVRKVKGVDEAIGILMSSGAIEFNDKRRFSSVVGVSTEPEYAQFLKDFDFFNVEDGRYLQNGDVYKVIVGSDVGDAMFGKDLGVNDKIMIEDIDFRVVGVLEDSGNPAANIRIIIPIETAKDLFNKTDEYSTISARAQKGAEPSEVAEKIEEKLRRSRGVKEDEEDFSVQTSESIVEAFKNVFGIVTAVLTGIAFISLIVGGVGIMTTMYTSVLERTRQIGLMKSVGARNSDILLLFITEAGLIGFVGGIIGILIGLGFAKIGEIVVHYYGIDDFAMWAGPELLLGAMLFSIGIGCVSGYFPAKRASEMSPVDALRYR